MKDFFNAIKPILFLAVLPTVVILGVMFVTQGITQNTKATTANNNTATSNSTVRINQTNFNFGTISQKDGLVNTVYEVTNTGQEDIYLKEMYTSCGCTKAQLLYADGSVSGLYAMKGMAGAQDFTVGKSIKPGETVKIKATFDPNAHGPQGIGYIKRNIMLNTNIKDNSLIQVSFEAEVTK
jgi:hypothetical protein